MTEKPSIAALSFSFEMRGELPGDMGLFYQDAGKGRAAFEAARSELPGGRLPKDRDINSKARISGTQQGYRTPNYSLSDPRPSFALPNRKLRDETWFQELRVRPDGAAMTREEFMAARREGAHTGGRSKDPIGEGGKHLRDNN